MLTHTTGSKNKIIWADINFVGYVKGKCREYAYHKIERCRARRDFTVPAPFIRRYRIDIEGRKPYDVTVCDACKVPVGKSAVNRLRKHFRDVDLGSFGPGTRWRQTDYYQIYEAPVV